MERAGTFGSKGYVEEAPLPAGRELGYAACKDTGFLLGCWPEAEIPPGPVISLQCRGPADSTDQGQPSLCFGGEQGHGSVLLTLCPSASIQSRFSEALSVMVLRGWCHIQQLVFPSPVRGDWLVCFGPGEASLSHLWARGGQDLLVKYLAVQESLDGFGCVQPPASIYTLYPDQYGENWTWGVTALLRLELRLLFCLFYCHFGLSYCMALARV